MVVRLGTLTALLCRSSMPESLPNGSKPFLSYQGCSRLSKTSVAWNRSVFSQIDSVRGTSSRYQYKKDYILILMCRLIRTIIITFNPFYLVAMHALICMNTAIPKNERQKKNEETKDKKDNVTQRTRQTVS